MKKGSVHAAVAAIVFISACVLAVPRIAAADASDSSSQAASGTTKRAIEVRTDLYQIPSPVAAQLGIKTPNATITDPADAKKLLLSLKRSKEVTRVLSPVFTTVEDREATISVSGDGPGKWISITACPQIVMEGLISVDAKVRFTSKPAAPASGTPQTPDIGESLSGPADLAATVEALDGETAIAVGPMLVGSDVLVLAVTPKLVR